MLEVLIRKICGKFGVSPEELEKGVEVKGCATLEFLDPMHRGWGVAGSQSTFWYMAKQGISSMNRIGQSQQLPYTQLMECFRDIEAIDWSNKLLTIPMRHNCHTVRYLNEIERQSYKLDMSTSPIDGSVLLLKG